VVNITQAHTTGQHLSYLTHGKGRNGADAALFGPDATDRRAFVHAAEQDPRQFRLVVSPEHPSGFDRDRVITDLMVQMERDLGVPLAWVAAHHHDTAHPHTHVAVRGVDRRGQEWFMAKHYKQGGLQARAAQLLTSLLGYRLPEVETAPPRLVVQVAQMRRVRDQQHGLGQTSSMELGS
jgi:type IV secretory pathway VirD2 relaxase